MNAFFLVASLGIVLGMLLNAFGIPFFLSFITLPVGIFVRRVEIRYFLIFTFAGVLLSMRFVASDGEVVGKIESFRDGKAVVTSMKFWTHGAWKWLPGKGYAKLQGLEGAKVYCKSFVLRNSYPEYLLKDCVTFALKESFIEKLKLKVWKSVRGFKETGTLTSKIITSSSPEKALKAGISHIFAVSGFHTALYFFIAYLIVSAIFTSLFITYPLALLLTFILIIPSGPSPSAVRAFTMLLVWSFSKIVDYPISKYNILGIAAFFSLVSDPYAVLSPSFVLSYAATFGIIFSIENGGKWWEIPIWAYLFSLPFSLLYFEKISLLAVVASSLIAPIMPLYLLGGSSAFLLHMCGLKNFSGLLIKGIGFLEVPLRFVLDLFSKLPPLELPSYLSWVVSFVLVWVISVYWLRRSSIKS